MGNKTGGNYLSRVLEQGGALWNAVRLVQDNWQNVFTGLGTSRDKTQYGRFVGLGEIRETELTNLYHQDDTAKKAVALKPQEMMRQGFTINIEDDPDASTATLKDLRRLNAAVKIRDAMIWGRLYGGSAVLIGADDGLPSEEPLNEDAIKTIRFLHVIDKRHLVNEQFFTQPLSDEFFGEPSHYRITPRRSGTVGNIVVHRSRLLLFGGAHTSDEERDRLGMWDHSVITPMYQTLRQFNNVWQAAEHLMSDASQAVFKIQGLMSMIAGGQKEDLQTRMQLVDMSRSVARAVLLDTDGGEEFARENSSFTDAASMIDKFMMRLASAADIPVTILMGRSPAGQNATGDADFRWFYDNIRTAQENDLRPRLERLVEIIFRAKDGPTNGNVPEAWDLKFAPLWQMTPDEQASLEKTHAEKDQIYLNAGVVLPEEIALSRFRAEGWSPDVQIDRDAREALLKEGDAEDQLRETEEPVEPEETEPEETEESEPEDAQAGKIVLAPTDIATVVTVNEARASQGLGPWPDAEEGKLTVAEFRKRKEAAGETAGVAEGEVEAEEIDPGSKDKPAPPPPMPPGFGAPPPADEDGEESDESGETSGETEPPEDPNE